jgi:hypothetical protein
MDDEYRDKLKMLDYARRVPDDGGWYHLAFR